MGGNKGGEGGGQPTHPMSSLTKLVAQEGQSPHLTAGAVEAGGVRAVT